MEHGKRDIGGLTASAGFLLLGVCALWGTEDMSPLGSVFPRAIGSAMVALSALHLVWRSVKPQREEQPPTGSISRRLLVAAIMLAWALLLRYLGFPVTTVAAALLLLLVANHEPWTPARAAGYVLSTLAVVGGLYLVFAFGLNVPLPTGTLF